jgi:hypothetical protein
VYAGPASEAGEVFALRKLCLPLRVSKAAGKGQFKKL